MNIRIACVAVGCWILAGCAAPRLTPLNRGEPVTFIVAMGTSSITGRIRNLTIAEDSKTGAQVGLVAGGLTGFACGPFWWLCVPVFGITGMYPGGLIGAGVGVIESLSSDKVNRLGDRLQRYGQAHDLPGEIQAGIVARAKKYWPISNDTAGTVVSVELEDIYLNSMRGEKIALILRVAVAVRGTGTPAGETPSKIRFEYAGPISSYASWIDEESDFVDATFRSAIEHIAAQIIAELSPVH